MKKLIITVVITLFTVGVYAQIQLPNEANCTEEAFTFRTDIRAGWHFNTPMLGHAETIRIANTYASGWNYKFNNPLPKEMLPMLPEKTMRADSLFEANRARMHSIAFYQVRLNLQAADSIGYGYRGYGKYPNLISQNSPRLVR